MLKKTQVFDVHVTVHRDKYLIIKPTRCTNCGPDSSAGIANNYGLDDPGYRIPVGRDFPPVQTGPGAHPASCTMGTWSFPGANYGRDVLLTTPPPLLVPWSWKSTAIPLPTLWATTGPVTVTLHLLYIQSVTRGTDQTSGGCSLC